MQGKIDEWNSSFLSYAGKEALVKSCVQAYPVFAMSCFHFPRSLCDKLTAKVVSFWWATGNKNKGIHWMGKDTLQREEEMRYEVSLFRDSEHRATDEANVAHLQTP